jgi:hypothetical protein
LSGFFADFSGDLRELEHQLLECRLPFGFGHHAFQFLVLFGLLLEVATAADQPRQLGTR